MPHDLADTLGLELKKEMAERYFGFRKLIDEDKLDLAEKARHYILILEKRISFDLIRIYILLRNEDRIRNFLHLIGIDKKLFYDPYLTESPTIRQRVFQGIKIRGLTRSGIFKKLLQDCYERLVSHVEQYRALHDELVKMEATLNEEIDLFQRNADLGSILGFLHGLGAASSQGDLQGSLEQGIAADLEKKLQFTHSDLVAALPILPPLPAYASIKKELKKLGNAAFAEQKAEFPHSYIAPARATDASPDKALLREEELLKR